MLTLFIQLLLSLSYGQVNECSQYSTKTWYNSELTRQELACFLLNIQDYSVHNSPSIDNLISYLPTHFKRNFALKHGEKQVGANGHRSFTQESQSADPDFPRAFLWDEATGLTISYNGHEGQSQNHRLDIYDFDFEANTHKLIPWHEDNPIESATQLHGGYYDAETCTSCHGPRERPIWPMYPDWPTFYGSFNDEMRGYSNSTLNRLKKEKANNSDIYSVGNGIQSFERGEYIKFKSGQALTNPRYAPLYRQPWHLEYWFKQFPETNHSLFPYRANNEQFSGQASSRSFHHRPNLRLGVLYNRLVGLSVAQQIKDSPVYEDFPEVFLYSLMDCNWETYRTVRTIVFPKYQRKVQETYGYSVDFDGANNDFGEALIKNNSRRYRQFPYDELLKSVDVSIRDVDIRFPYNSRFYDTSIFHNTQSIMDFGYMKTRYPNMAVHDHITFTYIPDVPQMKYVSSYFDGSATTNELIAFQLLQDLGSKKSIFAKYSQSPYRRTLTEKYRSFPRRFARDSKFFANVDGMSPWIPMPFPRRVAPFHHRESFYGNTGRVSRHKNICSSLGNEIERIHRK